MSLPDPPLPPSTQAFDVHPGGRRAHHVSRFRQHLRLSFGPGRDEGTRGLDRLAGGIGAARRDSPEAQSP